MKKSDIEAFFVLLRVGLWADSESADLGNQGFTESVDWEKVYQLAKEQSLIGIILAGIEQLKNANFQLDIDQELLLQWIGEVQMLEQQNKSMNIFIGVLIERMRDEGIYALLLKGQGIAQCYEKPLWRSCGDVDLFFSNDNYQKAKEYLITLASSSEPEYPTVKHLGMTIDSWVVELHGLLRCSLSPSINRELDKIKKETFCGGNVRSWQNGGTQVLQLGAENDAIYVFIHFLNHFYKGGVGLRQICDWSRLLWTYRSELNLQLLESRIRKMGLMTEWKTFGALAVEHLGMPTEAMPLYDSRFKIKSERILEFVLETGNFGHNRDLSFYSKYPYLVRKLFAFGLRCKDIMRHAMIFPLDSMRFFPSIMYYGLRSTTHGE